MDRLKQIAIVLALAASILVSAQDKDLLAATKGLTTQTRETLYVHANATTFVIGETLHCKIYCLNPDGLTTSKISKIAYIELIDKARQSVFKQKLYLENGVGQGDFFIPTALKTGNYKLVAYTRWAQNQDHFAYEMNLSVINPFEPLEKKGITAAGPNTQKSQANEFFTVQPDKKTYALREKVSLKIQSLQLHPGHYSIGVRKVDALPYQSQTTAQEFAAALPKTITNTSISQLPELRGELLSGAIVSKKGAKDLNHKAIALSITGKSYALKIVETDRLGRFTFVLDQYPSGTNLTLQVMEDNRSDFSIRLDDDRKTDWSALQFLSETALGPELRGAIEERSVASQIENAYYARKKDSLIGERPSNSFFHSNEKEYILDDYTRFPSVKETIIEVLKELYFTRKDGKYTINLRNYVINNEGYGLPLLLVDGLLIQDANALFDYNPENIYKVSIVNQPYAYGPKTFSGVINITTKNQDYQTKAVGDYIVKTTIQRPLNPKLYFNPDYAKATNSRIPDYRQQLLWQPDLQLGQMQNTLGFYTSDLTGTFEIVLEGFTDSGEPVSVKEFFEVK